ncbi:leucine-rich repeat domain-containing protein [Skeletonema marinoi]|uniref:Leucine-rich repeat domain-containing protein n=1 Tax=Skeletonema marinoi TaxID=267567 RepID=A0AAD9D4Y7_9STRA|nr:leucine-rich repeat domain-containing protein [Skeletonema marinoi]
MDNNTLTSAAMTTDHRGLLPLELEQAKIIRSLLRKEGAAAAGVVREKEGMALNIDQLADFSTELLLTVLLLRLLDERAEGRVAVAVPSSASSDEQLEDDAAADKMKKKRAAAAAKKKEKKKRYKRNKAAAKQKQKQNKTTKLMSWIGGGLISLMTMIAFGSIMTFVVPLSLIHQSDGSGERKAPPALPPSASKPLRQKQEDIRSNNNNAASVSSDIINHPLAAVVPPPIFSPSAVTVSNRRMKSDANATFNEIERNALIDFYDSANGAEWTYTTNWLYANASYCNWWGVTCNEMGHVTELVLADNSLWGTLSESIGNLTFIEVLDLSDNDMKGSIPKEIGLLSNLTYLRLSYNAFTGAVPESLRELTKLQLVHLQSNRITEVSNIPQLGESDYFYSTFVTDCGVPSVFDEVLECDNCTMCCNANEECRPPEHMKFSLNSFAAVYVAYSFVSTVIYVSVRYHFENRKNRRNAERGLEEDEKFPLDRFCKDSVYSYFATDSVAGWLIAVIILCLQVWMYVHILGIVDKKINKPFTWKCPRNSDVCKDTADFSWAGIVIFMLIVSIYLAKDVIEADKLLSHSYKSRHPRRSRIQYFISGFGLFSITLYAEMTSIFYTTTTATSDADLVFKALTVLFVTQLDEKVFSALEAYNEKWAMLLDKRIFAMLGACNEKWTAHAPDSEDSNSDTDAEKGSTIEEIKREIESQQEELKLQQEQMTRQNDEITVLSKAVQTMQESQAVHHPNPFLNVLLKKV